MPYKITVLMDMLMLASGLHTSTFQCRLIVQWTSQVRKIFMSVYVEKSEKIRNVFISGNSFNDIIKVFLKVSV